MTMITVSQPEAGAAKGLPAYLARPDGVGPWPGVVLVHDAQGLVDSTVRHADRVADLGYLVIAPDLFGDGGRRRSLRRTLDELHSADGGIALAGIAAARQWLLSQAACTGKIGVLGNGLGGGLALRAATRFDVCSVGYGPVPEEGQLVGACPIVGSYGRRDLSLVGATQKLAEILVRQGIEFDLKEYPHAGHAFLSDEPVKLPWYLWPVRSMTTIGPDPRAATDAWMRIDGFLRRFLRSGADPGSPGDGQRLE